MRWLEELRHAMLAAGSLVEEPFVVPRDKPNEFLVEFHFRDELERKSWSLVKIIADAFAEVNDGHILFIDVGARGMRFVVAMERRYNVHMRNPLTE